MPKQDSNKPEIIILLTEIKDYLLNFSNQNEKLQKDIDNLNLKIYSNNKKEFNFNVLSFQSKAIETILIQKTEITKLLEKNIEIIREKLYEMLMKKTFQDEKTTQTENTNNDLYYTNSLTFEKNKTLETNCKEKDPAAIQNNLDTANFKVNLAATFNEINLPLKKDNNNNNDKILIENERSNVNSSCFSEVQEITNENNSFFQSFEHLLLGKNEQNNSNYENDYKSLLNTKKDKKSKRNELNDKLSVNIKEKTKKEKLNGSNLNERIIHELSQKNPNSSKQSLIKTYQNLIFYRKMKEKMLNTQNLKKTCLKINLSNVNNEKNSPNITVKSARDYVPNKYEKNSDYFYSFNDKNNYHQKNRSQNSSKSRKENKENDSSVANIARKNSIAAESYFYNKIQENDRRLSLNCENNYNKTIMDYFR